MADERMTLERRAEIENCVWQRQNEAPTVYSAVDKITDDLLTELRAVEQENRTLREAYDGTQRILASGVGMLESLDRIAKLHKMGRGARAGGGTDA